MTTKQYEAYQLAKESSEDPMQIVELYDGTLRFLQQVKDALEENNHQIKFNALRKASMIIGGLKECLDLERGGQSAKALDDFYSAMEMQLLSLYGDGASHETLDEVMGSIRRLRDAWEESIINLKKQEDTGSASKDNPKIKQGIAAAAKQGVSDLNLSI